MLEIQSMRGFQGEMAFFIEAIIGKNRNHGGALNVQQGRTGSVLVPSAERRDSVTQVPTRTFGYAATNFMVKFRAGDIDSKKRRKIFTNAFRSMQEDDQIVFQMRVRKTRAKPAHIECENALYSKAERGVFVSDLLGRIEGYRVGLRGEGGTDPTARREQKVA